MGSGIPSDPPGLSFLRKATSGPRTLIGKPTRSKKGPARHFPAGPARPATRHRAANACSRRARSAERRPPSISNLHATCHVATETWDARCLLYTSCMLTAKTGSLTPKQRRSKTRSSLQAVFSCLFLQTFCTDANTHLRAENAFGITGPVRIESPWREGSKTKVQQSCLRKN